MGALRTCGRDRASAKDPEQVPASCDRLTGELRTVPAPVQHAVAGAGADAARRGFTDSMKITLWVEVALLGLTFFVAFLLPAQARPQE